MNETAAAKGELPATPRVVPEVVAAGPVSPDLVAGLEAAQAAWRLVAAKIAAPAQDPAASAWGAPVAREIRRISARMERRPAGARDAEREA